MLVQGVIAKLAAVFIIIPEPIIGGIFCVMFGMIAALGNYHIKKYINRYKKYLVSMISSCCRIINVTICKFEFCSKLVRYWILYFFLFGEYMKISFH